jgi:diguanylate cyclase (GGDEF)-like protein
MLFASLSDPRIKQLLTDSANLQHIIESAWEHLMIFNINKELHHHSSSNNRNLQFSTLQVEHFVSMIDLEFQASFLSQLNHAWGNSQMSSLEYVLNVRDSEPVWIHSDFCYVQEDNEQDACLLVLSKEISKFKHYEAYLKSLAYNDPLTNLPNRRALIEHYQQTAAFAKRYNLQLGILYIDVDDFKEINDHFGHDGGDHFLKHIALAVGDCLRESDILARIGGDEFVVLLNNILSLKVVDTVIHRIYKVMANGLKLKGEKANISLSIGAAIYPIHGDSLDKLLQSADTALYQAKKNNKNTYWISSENIS